MTKQTPASLTIRGSSLPHLNQCSAPLGEQWEGIPVSEGVSVAIDEAHDAADLGSAVHAALREAVNGQEPDLAAIGKAHGVAGSDELETLYAMGRHIWNRVKQHYPGPLTELACNHAILLAGEDRIPLTLTGTIDVASYADEAGSELRILDWKTGRNDRDHYHQMAGYAYLASRYNEGVKLITATLVWIRDGRFETFAWTREEIERWAAETLVGGIWRTRNTFRPGPACEWCVRDTVCPARRSMVWGAMEDLVGPEADLTLGDMIEALDDPERRQDPAVIEAIGKLWGIRGAVQKALDRFTAGVRSSVLSHGALPISETHEIRMTEGERTSIDAEKAWPIIVEAVGDKKLKDVVGVKKGALDKIVRDSASEGVTKKDRLEAFYATLRGAGAVTTTTTRTMREGKRKKKETFDAE
jgi:hypothetical protein